MKKNSVINDALMLFIIAFVMVTILSLAKVGTQKAIDASILRAKTKAYVEVCPGYNSGENITDDVKSAATGYNATLSADGVLRCRNEVGDLIGYIVNCTSKGYGGPLNLIVGFDGKGTVTGVRYANIPSETPGLGMKTTEDSFLNSWIEHNIDNIDSVDTISGATISSTAFKQAVSLACSCADRAANIDGGK